MDEHAQIKDLTVVTGAQLTGDVRKQLGIIIEAEFNNRVQSEGEMRKQQQEKALKQYRDSTNFAELKKGYGVISRKIEALESQLAALVRSMYGLGLDHDGDKICYFDSNKHPHEAQANIVKLNKLLQEATAESTELITLKNKIMARLQLSQTVGEAAVIMREVLGNGIIPSLDIKQLTATV
jgi:hypothetical protein